MKFNPQKLRPIDLVRLLNSTPLGEVINDRQLRRHRVSVGFRVGDGKTVDLFRYLAWRFELRHFPKQANRSKSYEEKKDDARNRSIKQSELGRNIGKMPKVVNPKRKKSCKRNLKRFLEIYLKEVFHLPWCEDHLKAIERLQNVILHGGQDAFAMTRGTGKTSLTEGAGLWAVLYGHHLFGTLVGSDKEGATQLLDSIKIELETNDLLLGDFPEVCFPIRCLEGNAQRCIGQLYEGKRTAISWKANELILPTIKGSPASGCILKTAGITGRIRGMNHKLQNGKTIRPSFVIIDDPQTDESAESPEQCRKRKKIIMGAIMKLSGPGVKPSVVMPCTVIAKDDLADQMLDREKHPEWSGFRAKMVYAFPKNEALWEEYNKIRIESLNQFDDIRLATEFYRKNRAAMDEGAKVAWAARFNHDELSAIQHAMNLMYEDEESFWAECQNEPPAKDLGGEILLSAEEIAAKTNGYSQYAIPLGCNLITAFIDVQKLVLFYGVVAWEDNGSGYIVDYGTFPDQNKLYFIKRNIKRNYGIKGSGWEAALFKALEDTTDLLLDREWKRDDGVAMKINRCLIDASWGASNETVYQFCRQTKHSAIVMPYHGRFVGAGSVPFSEYRKKRGDKVGHNWRIPSPKGKRVVRYVLADVNYWKRWIFERFRVLMGDAGCLSLFGRDPKRHRLLADHLTAEYVVRTEGRGRVVDEFKEKPNKPDNDFLDVVTGCAVGASMEGVKLQGTTLTKKKKKRKRVRLSDLRRKRGI